MKRLVEIDTPLEPDVLLFQKMRATEELGRLSEYELDLLSDRAITLDDVLGKSITVKLELTNEKVRSFSGYVTRIALVGTHGRYQAYRATVRPWLWFLTRTTNCRIFQDKSVPDILKDVFAKHSDVADVKFELTESYTPWDYCVQYRETDFNFVSRLMEHEGMYYFFTHSEGRHTLVVADSYSAHMVANGGEIPFIEAEQLGRKERNHVSEWSNTHELRSGKYAMTDYDFEKPSVDLQVKSGMKREYAMAEYEKFEYPGDYLERGDGELYVRTRMEEEQAKFERVQGQTNARALATGTLFTLTSHPHDEQNTEYLVVSTEYELKSTEYESAEAVGADYRCRFSALNSHQPFRAERTTPKPIVQGPQTAITVGPTGETIHTDKFGRVKVQFHWDRYGKKDDKSSCWIRVSQNWGGKGWGGMFIPHVGQEVIVQFEDGDPDRPLITGRVYNAENMPPVALPAGKTQSVIRDHGGNEMIMEGHGGVQQIRLHSPHHDTTFTMGNSITWNSKGKWDVTIGGFEKVAISEYSAREITGYATESVGDYWTQSVKNAAQIESKTAKVDVNAATTILVKAGDQITLEVGSSSLTMDKAGVIHLKGTKIDIEGSESVTIHPKLIDIVGSSAVNIKDATISLDGKDVKIHGATITSTADGGHAIKGSKVEIN